MGELINKNQWLVQNVSLFFLIFMPRVAMVVLIFIMAGEFSVFIVVAAILTLGCVGIKSLGLAVDVEGLTMVLEDDVLHES